MLHTKRNKSCLNNRNKFIYLNLTKIEEAEVEGYSPYSDHEDEMFLW